MYNTLLRNLSVFCTSVLLLFAQDVTLTLDGDNSNLNYVSSSDIAGFQFSHSGCAAGATGGDAAANGFMVSASSGVVLGFSLTGGTIPEGAGTLVEGVNCETISNLVFSGVGGITLETVLSVDEPASPAVTIVFPAEGSEFTDATSIDVTVSGSDMGDGDHYHAYLDGQMQGMFYTDSFSINVGFGDHVLTVDVADGSHNSYEGSGSSVSFSNTESVATCDDDSACNTGAEGDCTYADDNYDCDGNCTADLDCDGACGGSNGASLQDCYFDGDGDGCFETLDQMTTCSCELEGGASSGGDCSPTSSSVDVLYCSDADIYGFQFNVSGATLIGASGGASEANGLMVSASTASGNVIGFSMTGSSIPGNTCDVLVTLEIEGDGSPCVGDLILSGEGGSSLDASIDDCLTIFYSAPVATCDDDSACNTGAEGDCTYAEDNYDCDGNCTASVDCDGACGGSAVEDSCGVCGGDGSSCDNSVSLSLMATDGGLDVYMNNTAPVAGF
ncbi:MAG: hypothetical protein HOA66_08900, partial [Candidatus Marinimicrobia bacterium]|nr:hypothetical protein [Candidatus Neomarinimicrobiota bacterium]